MAKLKIAIYACRLCLNVVDSGIDSVPKLSHIEASIKIMKITIVKLTSPSPSSKFKSAPKNNVFRLDYMLEMQWKPLNVITLGPR